MAGFEGDRASLLKVHVVSADSIPSRSRVPLTGLSHTSRREWLDSQLYLTFLYDFRILNLNQAFSYGTHVQMHHPFSAKNNKHTSHAKLKDPAKCTGGNAQEVECREHQDSVIRVLCCVPLPVVVPGTQ